MVENMITAKELFNKIKWDKLIDEKGVLFTYQDFYTEIKANYSDILEVDGQFIELHRVNRFTDKHENVFIPLHKVRKVYEGDEIVWYRDGTIDHWSKY